MKFIHFILITTILTPVISCKPTNKPIAVKEAIKEDIPLIKEDLDALNKEYIALRDQVEAYRIKANKGHFSDKEIKNYLFNIITKDYYNYWEGTDWDFNGITETPRNGLIACGYYVTTNLKHASVNLNRYKFAQQLGSVIINSMCDKKSIKRLAGLERIENYLNKYTGNKLFILAMDNHVGFVVRENDTNYFMHSGFTGKAVVVKELLSESDIIQGSYNFMIGDLLGNDTFIEQWKLNSRIVMISY